MALTPFDDKRICLNSIKSLPWYTHTQSGMCGCLLCLKIVYIYQNEFTELRTDEMNYLNTRSLKQTLTHHQFVKLIKDLLKRVEFLNQYS